MSERYVRNIQQSRYTKNDWGFSSFRKLLWMARNYTPVKRKMWSRYSALAFLFSFITSLAGLTTFFMWWNFDLYWNQKSIYFLMDISFSRANVKASHLSLMPELGQIKALDMLDWVVICHLSILLKQAILKITN